jgi:pimeloyl-ACP methyl ester carboxylesterase
MPHLDLNGAAIYYETAGHVSGPAVVLIHAGIATLRMWDTLVPVLAENHFVIAYDTRGFGKTTAEDVEYSDRADARDLLDHLGIDSATVIGCSRGGGIAIDLALEFPDRVAGLVTIGSGPSGFPYPPPTAAEDALWDRVDAAFAAEDWALLADLEVRLWAIGPTRNEADLDPDFVDLAYVLHRVNLKRSHEKPKPLPLEPPAYDRTVDIDVPTLVTVGDHDLSETLVAFEYLSTTIPTADSVRFSRSAHLPSVEEAAEFNRVLGIWLAENAL